jgi:hypothetical protein
VLSRRSVRPAQPISCESRARRSLSRAGPSPSNGPNPLPGRPLPSRAFRVPLRDSVRSQRTGPGAAHPGPFPGAAAPVLPLLSTCVESIVVHTSARATRRAALPGQTDQVDQLPSPLSTARLAESHATPGGRRAPRTGRRCERGVCLRTQTQTHFAPTPIILYRRSLDKWRHASLAAVQ